MNLYQKKKRIDGLINTTRAKISQTKNKLASLFKELEELLLTREDLDEKLQKATITLTQDKQ